MAAWLNAMNYDNRNRYELVRRVVVTGIGVVAPNGNTLETFWGSIETGTSAAVLAAKAVAQVLAGIP